MVTVAQLAVGEALVVKMINRKKIEIVNQDLDGSLSLSLFTEIPVYMERNLYMNQSRLSYIWIDMPL